ncbi:hypothetical protein CEW81_10230 [Kluyvera genomosp. 3]|uniref:Uncharacterized protein n=1 Tax=Kluyvera genomosp. 3 TaxID=2774055 RepID=A0A248KI38_9ENTR|nr:hypothetical protein CEW81_10230 [Kluyvera genomosp. 3]
MNLRAAMRLQKRRRTAQQVAADMLPLVVGQAVLNKIVTQRHIQNAVGFTQSLGVHLAWTVVRNPAVYLIAGIDVGVAHQQGTHFIAISLLSGELPQQPELLTSAGVTAIHLSPPRAVPRLAAEGFTVDRAAMAVRRVRLPDKPHPMMRAKIVQIPGGNSALRNTHLGVQCRLCILDEPFNQAAIAGCTSGNIGP